MAAGTLMDVYGLYDQAYNRYGNAYNDALAQYQSAADRYNTLLGQYQNKADVYNAALDQYLGKVDEYNNLANLYNADVKNQQEVYKQQIANYNASLINDGGQYSQWNGDYSGSGPYTTYNGHTIGRVSPIETYQAQGYTNYGTDEYGNSTQSTNYYDPRSGLGYQPQQNWWGGQTTYTGEPTWANENSYLDPNSGLVSIFAPRPANEFNPTSQFTGVNPGTFDLTAPTFTETMPMFNAPDQPIAPTGQTQGTATGNVKPEELYQKTFGRGTSDVLSNEAWSLSNIGTPFLSSEPSTSYETGGVAAINNPLSYVGPDALTTGNASVDQNSLIAGENPYYMT